MFGWLSGTKLNKGQKGIVKINSVISQFENWIEDFKTGIESCRMQIVDNDVKIGELKLDNENLNKSVDQATNCIQGIKNLMEGAL